jgi:hypothetical protein
MTPQRTSLGDAIEDRIEEIRRINEEILRMVRQWEEDDDRADSAN